MASASPFIILYVVLIAGVLASRELYAMGSGNAATLISLVGPRNAIGRLPFPFLAIILAFGYGSKEAQVFDLYQLLGLTLAGTLLAFPWLKQRARILFEAAAFWCIAPLLSIVALHNLYRPAGAAWSLNPALLLLVPLWIGDSLAYFVGRKFGRHLLAPSISPKKTVEGALANLIGCIGGGAGFSTLMGMPLWIGLVVGALAGVLGQAGDLFESALKRSSGLKDSGALLPGHGGLLDRIDSLLFAAPVQALFLALVWPPR